MNNLAIDLVCDIYSPSGYSAHAREIIRSLHPLCDLKIVDHKHDRISVDLDPAEVSLFKKLQDKTRKPAVRINFETPEFFDPIPGVINLGFTQWETTRIPDTDYKNNERNNWVKQMNRMQGMITSCATAVDSFRNSGVTVPISYFYGPIDVDLHRPGLPELPIDDLVYDKNGEFIPREKRPLVVGMVAQWTLRKNIEDFLITMFARFKQNQIHIILKSYGSTMDQHQAKLVEDRVREISNWVKNPDAPRISLITEKLTDSEIAQLYCSMDVYVSTSRGEGFCMPVAQAMASGCIPVVCGFSAPGEYVTHQDGYVLPYQLKPAVGMTNGWYRSDQDWADVDCIALETAIRSLAADHANGNLTRMNGMKQSSRDRIVSSMSHAVAGKNLLAIIEQMAAAPCPT